MKLRSMKDLRDASDAEAGRLIKEIAEEYEDELEEVELTRTGLATFFDEIGMDWLGDAIREAGKIWRMLSNWFESWFS